MAQESKIEWTRGDDGSKGKTWNPVRGCTKVSPGCKHCYAETFAERWRGVQGHAYEKGFDPRFVLSALNAPLRWRKACRVFVNSMSDLFHEDFKDEEIDAVFGAMWACLYLGRDGIEGHTFQVLTKRAERMRDYMLQDRRKQWAAAAVNVGGGIDPDGVWDQTMRHKGPHPRIWLGVSVENQEYADKRLPCLVQVPAAVRFVSAEPLLGRTKLGCFLREHVCDEWPNAEEHGCVAHWMPGIDWVIVGGESGPGSRPFDLAWGRSIVEECNEAGVPVFFKQAGANVHDSARSIVGGWAPGDPEPDTRIRFLHRKGGDPSEWSEDLRVRQFPKALP